jgi:hypothetical protein
MGIPHLKNSLSLLMVSKDSIERCVKEKSSFLPQTQPTTAIADSFPGMETMQPVAAHPSSVPVQLKQPPKWLKRPVGASFGFGGKLVTFEALKAPANQQQQPGAKQLSGVCIKKVS